MAQTLDVARSHINGRRGTTVKLRGRYRKAEDAGFLAPKQIIGQRMSPAMRRHVEESRSRFYAQSAKLGQTKAAMTMRHCESRDELDRRLAAEWLAEM